MQSPTQPTLLTCDKTDANSCRQRGTEPPAATSQRRTGSCRPSWGYSLTAPRAYGDPVTTTTYKGAHSTAELDDVAGTLTLVHKVTGRPIPHRGSPRVIPLDSIGSVDIVRERLVEYVRVTVPDRLDECGPLKDDPNAIGTGMRDAKAFVALVLAALPGAPVTATDEAVPPPPSAPLAPQANRNQKPKKPGFWSVFDDMSNNA